MRFLFNLCYRIDHHGWTDTGDSRRRTAVDDCATWCVWCELNEGGGFREGGGWVGPNGVYSFHVRPCDSDCHVSAWAPFNLHTGILGRGGPATCQSIRGRKV